MKKGYGISLSHPLGLRDVAIYGATLSAASASGPYRLSALGDPWEDGSYHIPLHCHGENLMSGEEFAAAVLAVAKENTNLTASLDGYMLTYTSKATVKLFPDGRIRGAYGEIFSVHFSIRSPQTSASSLNSGIGLVYTSGAQTISFSCTSTEEAVTVIAASNATRQVNGLRITSTASTPRIIDIRSFGIYRGTVSTEAHSPYWGERKDLILRAPLHHYSPAQDIAYPMRGYVERWVESEPLTDPTITAVSLGSQYPTYRVEIPPQLKDQANVRLDYFSSTTSESSLISSAFWCMRAPEGDAFYITAKSTYDTVEKFASFFNSLGVRILTQREAPLIETFEKTTLSTKKGMNYLDLETAVAPGTLTFTYY